MTVFIIVVLFFKLTNVKPLKWSKYTYTEFNPNKTPAEISKEGLFGGAYLNVTKKYYIHPWKNFCDIIDSTDPKYFDSSFYGTSVSKHGVASGIFVSF